MNKWLTYKEAVEYVKPHTPEPKKEMTLQEAQEKLKELGVDVKITFKK